MSSTTIVTCYYMLDHSKQTHAHYMQWICNFMTIQRPKIIFTDKKTYDLVFHSIQKQEIYYYMMEFSEFKTYQYIDTFRKDLERDREKFRHNTYLYLLWNEKSDMLRKAIELNKFQSEYYIYCDIGYIRSLHHPQLYSHWPNINILKTIGNDKITLLQIEPFTEEEKQLDKDGLPISFYNVDRIGGGMIVGHKDILMDWYSKYYEMLEKFIEINRFIGKDQSIMTSVCILYPNMVHLVMAKVNQYCPDKWFYLLEYLRESTPVYNDKQIAYVQSIKLKYIQQQRLRQIHKIHRLRQIRHYK